MPYAGRIQAAGRTPQQVEAAIVQELQGKAVEPQALVNVSHNNSNTATVTGEVANGARVPLSQRGDRILDVVAAAGGYRSPVHETFISLTRGARTARAPLQALLTNPSENIFVRAGDTLTIESRPQTFTVAGATGVNAVIPFDARGATLEEAIAKAGGLNDNRADADGLFILRYEPARLVREFPDRAARAALRADGSGRLSSQHEGPRRAFRGAPVRDARQGHSLCLQCARSPRSARWCSSFRWSRSQPSRAMRSAASETDLSCPARNSWLFFR